MIRNSDFVFGKIAVTHQFADKQKVKQAIKLASALQVLGINKRVSQILYEEGVLSRENVCTIQYAMFQSLRTKKVHPLKTYNFTDQDDLILKQTLGVEKFPTDEKEGFPKVHEEVVQKYEISEKHIHLALNIQKNLSQAGFHIHLTTILHDKKLLSKKLRKKLPDLNSRRCKIEVSDFSSTHVRKYIAILFGKIAISKKKLSSEQHEKAILLWKEIETKWKLPLKYSELLFFLNFLSRGDALEVSLSLHRRFHIDQRPRFHLFQLSPEEHDFFWQLKEKNQLKEGIVEKCEKILKELQAQGLEIKLSEILVIKGYLSRKAITNKWALARKKEVAHKVRQLQMEKTEETQIDGMEGELEKAIEQTNFIISQVDQEEREHEATAETSLRAITDQEKSEEDSIEEELNQDFQESHQQQKQVIEEEIIYLKKRREYANADEAATIDTVLHHYQRSRKKMKTSLVGAAIFVFLFFVAFIFFLPKYQKRNLNTEKNPTTNENISATQQEKKRAVQLAEKAKTAFIKYHFSEAIQKYEKAIELSENKEDKTLYQEQVKLAKIYQTLINDLEQVVKTNPLLFRFRGKPVQLRAVSERKITLVDYSQNKIMFLPWQRLTPEEVYQIFSRGGLLERYPWELAIFCFENSLADFAREALFFYVQKYPEDKEKAWQKLAKELHQEVPVGGYLAAEGKLLTITEFQALQKEKIPEDKTIDPKELSPENSKQREILRWKNYQEQRLSKRRNLYSEEMKAQGSIFIRERWTKTDTFKKEEEILSKKKEGLVFFAEEWFQEKELGKWYLLALKKSYVQGYLKEKNKNLFQLRTPEGVRYLTSKQILKMKPLLSPWDRYWKYQKQISPEDIQARYNLGLWCEEQGFKLLAQIEFEKILTRAPNHSLTRHKLGYIYGKDYWQKLTSLKSTLVQLELEKLSQAFAQITSLEEEKNSSFFFLEEAALKLSQEGAKINPEELPYIVFGGKPRKVGPRKWILEYSFAPEEKKGPWKTQPEDKLESVSFSNGHLRVKASQNEAIFATLDVEFTGNLALRYRAQLVEPKEHNLYLKIFADSESIATSGYLLGLNYLTEATDKKNRNLIEAYLENKIQILDQATSPTIPSGKWYRITVLANEGNLSLAIAGQRILKAQNKEYQKGKIAFGTRGSQVKFDEIEITGEISSQWYEKRVQEIQTKLSQSQKQDHWYYIPASAIDKLAACSSQAKAKWSRARRLSLQGNFKEAYLLLTAAIEEEPKIAFFYVARSQVYLLLGNTGRALQDASFAIQLEPDIFTTHLARGEVYQSQKLYKSALDDYVKALSLAPRSILPYRSLAEIYLEMDRDKEALTIVKKYASVAQDKELSQAFLQSLKMLSFPQSRRVSSHYEVFSDQDKVPIDGFLQWLEEFMKEYQKITAFTPEKKQKVFLATNKSLFQTYLSIALPEISKNSICYYWPVTKELIVTTDNHPQVLYSQTLKASTTQLLAQEKQTVFPWIQEGLEKYFYAQGATSSDHNFSLANLSLRSFLDKNIFLGIETIAKLGEEEFYHPEELDFHSTYAHAWCHFLIKERPDQFRRYFSLRRSGHTQQEVFEKVFPSANKINREFKKYWKKNIAK